MGPLGCGYALAWLATRERNRLSQQQSETMKQEDRIRELRAILGLMGDSEMLAKVKPTSDGGWQVTVIADKRSVQAELEKEQAK